MEEGFTLEKLLEALSHIDTSRLTLKQREVYHELMQDKTSETARDNLFMAEGTFNYHIGMSKSSTGGDTRWGIAVALVLDLFLASMKDGIVIGNYPKCPKLDCPFNDGDHMERQSEY